jgi:hypothetical protein
MIMSTPDWVRIHVHAPFGFCPCCGDVLGEITNDDPAEDEDIEPLGIGCWTCGYFIGDLIPEHLKEIARQRDLDFREQPEQPEQPEQE